MDGIGRRGIDHPRINARNGGGAVDGRWKEKFRLGKIKVSIVGGGRVEGIGGLFPIFAIS